MPRLSFSKSQFGGRLVGMGLVGMCLALASMQAKAIVVGADLEGHYVERGTGLDGIGYIEIATGDGIGSCTGTLLETGRHVLSAAHCFDSNVGVIDSVNALFFGVDEEVQIGVDRITLHPAHDAITQGLGGEAFDLAVLELAVTAPEFVDRFALYEGNDEVLQIAQLVGFGRAGEGAVGWGESSPFGVSVTGFNRVESTGAVYEVLNAQYGFEFAVPDPDRVLLIDFDSGLEKDDAGVFLGQPDVGLGVDEAHSAPGDSGGPLLIDGKIAGVASSGGNIVLGGFTSDINTVWDGTFGELAGYTRVSANLDWIRAQTLLTSEPVTVPMLPWPALLAVGVGLFWQASGSRWARLR